MININYSYKNILYIFIKNIYNLTTECILYGILSFINYEIIINSDENCLLFLKYLITVSNWCENNRLNLNTLINGKRLLILGKRSNFYFIILMTAELKIWQFCFM